MSLDPVPEQEKEGAAVYHRGINIPKGKWRRKGWWCHHHWYPQQVMIQWIYQEKDEEEFL